MIFTFAVLCDLIISLLFVFCVDNMLAITYSLDGIKTIQLRVPEGLNVLPPLQMAYATLHLGNPEAVSDLMPFFNI